MSLKLWWHRGKSLSKSQSPPTDEPIIGWRWWNLNVGGLLQSSTRNVPWEPRKPMTVDDPNWHKDTGHPNGIHAYKFRRQLSGAQAYGSIAGSVSMWGRVIEHEHGYRAEFAYPRLLIVNSKTDILRIMDLEDKYGVPVTTDDELFQEPYHPYLSALPGAMGTSGIGYLSQSTPLANLAAQQSYLQNMQLMQNVMAYGSGLIKVRPGDIIPLPQP